MATQELEHDYEQLPILGYIIWYGLTGIKTDRTTLLNLLKQHGFQDYAPEPPTDKLALQRALREWIRMRGAPQRNAGDEDEETATRALIQPINLEQALLRHIREFLLELGVGFAFVGSQFHMTIADQDYYLDMLFYHLKLRCYVVIDLKIGEFKPEDAGKMNFYLSALDDLLRYPDDQPSIGVILCKSKNHVIVEYTLRDMRKPIGVAAYELTQALSEHLQMSLPTIAELEAALNDPEIDEAEDSQ